MVKPMPLNTIIQLMFPIAFPKCIVGIKSHTKTNRYDIKYALSLFPQNHVCHLENMFNFETRAVVAQFVEVNRLPNGFLLRGQW